MKKFPVALILFLCLLLFHCSYRNPAGDSYNDNQGLFTINSTSKAIVSPMDTIIMHGDFSGFNNSDYIVAADGSPISVSAYTSGRINAVAPIHGFASNENFVISIQNNSGIVCSNEFEISITPLNQQQEILGYSAVFPNISYHDDRRAIPCIMPVDAGIKSVSIYHNGGSGGFAVAIYYGRDEEHPFGLGWDKGPVPVAADEGWQTVDIFGTLPIPAGDKIWVAWIFEDNPGVRYQWTPDHSLGRANAVGSSWADSLHMPGSFGINTRVNTIWSVYVTYVPQTPGNKPLPEFYYTAVQGEDNYMKDEIACISTPWPSVQNTINEFTGSNVYPFITGGGSHEN